MQAPESGRLQQRGDAVAGDRGGPLLALPVVKARSSHHQRARHPRRANARARALLNDDDESRCQAPSRRPSAACLAARTPRAFSDVHLYAVDFLIKSGRAVIFPEYKGTFERFEKVPERGSVADRDQTIEQVKDLRRSIDYLETRPSDFDVSRLTYYGFSWGASEATISAAIENRFEVAVLASGGIPSRWKPRPEVDPVNFAPHVKIPVLMVNGRYDYVLPLETSQEPLFRLLGTAPADKRRVVLESGHGLLPMPFFKEVLDWLDHYLGPVK